MQNLPQSIVLTQEKRVLFAEEDSRFVLERLSLKSKKEKKDPKEDWEGFTGRPTTKTFVAAFFEDGKSDRCRPLVWSEKKKKSECLFRSHNLILFI